MTWKTCWAMATVLVLLIVGYGFGAERQSVPTPKWSEVHCDPTLRKNTIKCNFPSFTERARAMQRVSRVNCKAWFSDPNTIHITIINEFSHMACYEDIHCTVRDGMFACQYIRGCKGAGDDVLCSAERQELILDKKTYRKGQVITGQIDCEFSGKCTLFSGEKKPIIVKGVFKTMLK